MREPFDRRASAMNLRPWAEFLRSDKPMPTPARNALARVLEDVAAKLERDEDAIKQLLGSRASVVEWGQE